MPRWLWWAPFVVFLTATAGLGLRYGWLAANITETDVITKYAAHYLAERQKVGSKAALSDCVAFPGAAQGIWIVVSCRPGGRETVQSYDYYVNRLGGLEHSLAPLNLSPRPTLLPEYDS